MNFTCRKCGGHHFGTRLGKDNRIIKIECHNDAQGRPYEITPEASAERKRKGEKLVLCGWSGPPPT